MKKFHTVKLNSIKLHNIYSTKSKDAIAIKTDQRYLIGIIKKQKIYTIFISYFFLLLDKGKIYKEFELEFVPQ